MHNSANKYSQGQWQPKSSLEIARSHCPTVAYKGKIYGFGGGGPNFKSQNTTVIYDPETDSWSYGSNMPTLRSGSVAQLVGDRIYVIGGGFKQENGTFKFLAEASSIAFAITVGSESIPVTLKPLCARYRAFSPVPQQISRIRGFSR